MDLGEIRDFLLAWLVLSLALAMILTDMEMHGIKLDFGLSFTLSGLTMLTVFVVHEWGHRSAARGYGLRARFVAWPMGLLIGLVLTILTGIPIFLPGGVMIHPSPTKEQAGVISWSGLLPNLILGATMMLLHSAGIRFAWLVGVVNLWILVLNSIPLLPLDGYHLFRADKLVWTSLIIPGIIGIAYAHLTSPI